MKLIILLSVLPVLLFPEFLIASEPDNPNLPATMSSGETTLEPMQSENLPIEDAAASIPSEPEKQPTEKAEQQHKGFERLLQGDEPSYVAFTRDNDDSFRHLELYLSVKFPLFKKFMSNMSSDRTGLFINYNGKFDFFWGSRYSSPVISRKHNPGLSLEHTFKRPVFFLESIRSGYFHESNGQTIETLEEFQAKENAQDFVSRGWDYVPLDLTFGFPANFDFMLQGRYFLPKQAFENDKEDDIFWEPGRVDQPEIEDFDGVRLSGRWTFKLNHEYFEGIKFDAAYRTGYKSFNLSQRYSMTVRIGGLPVFVFYRVGYGNEISEYHIKSYSSGIGLELW